MAPGTRHNTRPNIDRTIQQDNMFEAEFDAAVPAANDPWAGNEEAPAAVNEQGFEDSFTINENTVGVTDTDKYEPNTDYLKYLEAKLKRVEVKNKSANKLSASDVLKSLKDVKEKQLEWSFKQGISSSEDDTLESDGSHVSGNTLTAELRRKMFPEQHALNETELLHLLDHDVIEKLFNNVDENSQIASRSES